MVILDLIQQGGKKKKKQHKRFQPLKKQILLKTIMNMQRDESNPIRVFTDGSVLFNVRSKIGGIGGIGVYFEDPLYQSMNCSEPFLCAPVTNIRAEIFACIRCVEQIIRYMDQYHIQDVWNILILTDSEFFINVMTKWIEGWKRKHWKKSDGADVLNVDLIYWFDSLLHIHRDRIRVQYQHVKAHRDPPKHKESIEYKNWHGNNEADQMARKASMQQHKMMGGSILDALTIKTDETPDETTGEMPTMKTKTKHHVVKLATKEKKPHRRSSSSHTLRSMEEKFEKAASIAVPIVPKTHQVPLLSHKEPTIMDTVVTSKRDRAFKSKRITDFWNENGEI